MSEELLSIAKAEPIEAEVLSTETTPVAKEEKVLAKIGAISDAIKDEKLIIAANEKAIANAVIRIREKRKAIAKSKLIIAQLEKANKLKQA